MKAVVFVDVQNDFVTGSLAAPGAKEKVPEIIKFAKECRNKGYALYATADTHDEKYENTLEGKRLPVKHCLKGTEGHKIVEGLVKDENRDVIIPQGHIFDKKTFGCEDLIERFEEDFIYARNSCLQDMNPRPELLGDMYEPLEEIILVGFCTSICVVSNALALRMKFPDVKITVMKDLCACVTPESHAAALKVMEMCQIDIV